MKEDPVFQGEGGIIGGLNNQIGWCGMAKEQRGLRAENLYCFP